MPKKTIQELHIDLLIADSDWSIALRGAFGSTAGDRRYDADKSAHPRTCQQAYANKKDVEKAFELAGGWELWRKDEEQRQADGAAQMSEEICG